jgi:predicted dehydrogenase
LEIKDNVGLPTSNPSINELLHFVECAQNGQEPFSSGYDNINTIRFIEAMYESDRTGKMVVIN